MGFIYTIIDKRGSGKTELAIEILKEDIHKSLLLVSTLVQRAELIKKRPELPIQNIYTLNSINATFGREMYKNIIVDSIKNISEFERTIEALTKSYGLDGNIYIFTSPTEDTQVDYYKANSSHTFSVNGFREDREKIISVQNFKKFYTDF